MMLFNPRTKTLSVEADKLANAGELLLAAIHYFRLSAGLPLEGGELNSDKDTCEYCILKAAKSIGLDLGAERPGKLDVREYK